jgi:hypothetical protein
MVPRSLAVGEREGNEEKTTTIVVGLAKDLRQTASATSSTFVLEAMSVSGGEGSSVMHFS